MSNKDILDMDVLEMAVEINADRMTIDELKKTLHAMSMRARRAEKSAKYWAEQYEQAARKAWSK